MLTKVEKNAVTAFCIELGYVGSENGIIKFRIIFLSFVQKVIFVFHNKNLTLKIIVLIDKYLFVEMIISYII